MSNPLEEIKQKLMIKPKVEERERVAVVIKGEKKPRKPIVAKKDKSEAAEVVASVLSDPSEEEGIVNEILAKTAKPKMAAPLIVDETNKGFDREALLKKLKESKMIKVVTKPHIEEIEEKKIIEPILPPPIKKAKKIPTKGPLIIEEEEDIDKPEKVAEEKFAEPVSPEEFEMKPKKKLGFIIEGDEGEEEEGKPKTPEMLPIIVPRKKERITTKPQKGVAILGPETIIQIGDTPIQRRLPKKSPPILIKVSSYYMNNREIFVNFINSLFEPYRIELQENKESISCDNIGKTSSNFSLLTHQKIVRDYLNLYTPYRGLLLYHGLGSGKTCTSIAIAEGMKEAKRIIVMTPASLQANYREELKKCGDLLYKRNQFWEWIATTDYPEALQPISAILNLPVEFIRRNGGAFFINIKKKPNYDELSDSQRKILEQQLNEMINQKYTFINYNGLRSERLNEMTAGYTKNIFDNAVVIIDEAHNLISRIVNKLKKEKHILGDEKRKKGEKKAEEKKVDEEKEESTENIFGEETPINLATKIYYMLLRAQNCRIVLLSGTPVINYPNEFGILFNILRGYIKTWNIPLDVRTTKKIDKNSLQEMFMGQKMLDYIDYKPASKILTITKNPYGFKNVVKKEKGYQGVTNVKKDEKGDYVIDEEVMTDDEFERKIISVLRRNDIEVIPDGIEVKNRKALPDTLDLFEGEYIDFSTKKLKNIDALKRRILGLSSYFKSAQESLLPRYNKRLGVDYHIIRIPMSDFQFKIYETARKQERLTEKKKFKNTIDELFKESTSTYRIFSRLFCNFVMPERPVPIKKSKKGEKGEKEEVEDEFLAELIKEARKEENRHDITNRQEGEVEGDEILDNIGGTDYKERLERAIKNIEEHSNDFLTKEALQTYSPKFLNILENIEDPAHEGLHLVYSQFRTAEGIGLFSLVLNKNGFARFNIKKNSMNIWEIEIPEVDEGKPTYALYTGTETSEEKEIIRHIYNGEWDQIPDSIGSVLKRKYTNNNMGQVIKVFMITSSGSEGINLRNTRYVHIMEPYWHPVRLEQVIGRARRICSHKDLPLALQTVEVFVYIMIFSPEQLKSDMAIELKNHDLSKSIPRVPQTSDQYLFEISEIKSNLTSQLTESIKESAFDCYIYSNGRCVNFSDPTNNKFSYVPDYENQPNDSTVKANKVAIEWVGKPVNLNGVEYVYRRMSKTLLNIYDKESYLAAMEDPTIIPLQIGTLETLPNGDKQFKELVV
jgi:hypothetical protein